MRRLSPSASGVSSVPVGGKLLSERKRLWFRWSFFNSVWQPGREDHYRQPDLREIECAHLQTPQTMRNTASLASPGLVTALCAAESIQPPRLDTKIAQTELVASSSHSKRATVTPRTPRLEVLACGSLPEAPERNPRPRCCRLPRMRLPRPDA